MSGQPEKDDIDRTPWVAVRISLSRNHRILHLRNTIEEAPRNLRWEAMGAMLDLWINTFTCAWADGDLSSWEAEDIEEMMGWKGKPGALVEAMKAVGFFEPGEGWKVAGWLKHQRRALRDRIRHFESSGKRLPTRAPAENVEDLKKRTKAALAARRSGA